MKRKTLLTILSLSVCMSMTACASNSQSEEKTAAVETTEEEAEEETAEEAAKEEAAAEEEEEAAEEEEEAAEEEAEDPKGLYTEDFEFSFDYKGCVKKMGAYTGLTVEVDPAEEVTDDAVQAEKDRRLAAIEKDVLTEGTVETGDIANIDYVGKKDDKEFQGGSAEGFDLTIGSGQFIPGFEDGLIGVSIGDTVDLNLTFPENYGAEELAGQDVVFTVTVNSVQRTKELTDDLVKDFTEGEYETIADYEAFVRSDLEAQAAEKQQSDVFNHLVSAIKEDTEFGDLPEDALDAMAADYYSSYETQSMMYGMQMEDFIQAYFGTSMEEFEKYTRLLAENTLSVQSLILNIADENDLLTVTEDEYTAFCEKIVEEFNMGTVDVLYNNVGQEDIRLELIIDRVEEYLLENNSFTEIKVEAEEAEVVEDAEETVESKDTEAVKEDAAEEETEDVQTEEESGDEAAEKTEKK